MTEEYKELDTAGMTAGTETPETIETTETVETTAPITGSGACPHCGALISMEQDICPICGEPLHGETSVVQKKEPLWKNKKVMAAAGVAALMLCSFFLGMVVRGRADAKKIAALQEETDALLREETAAREKAESEAELHLLEASDAKEEAAEAVSRAEAAEQQASDAEAAAKQAAEDKNTAEQSAAEALEKAEQAEKEKAEAVKTAENAEKEAQKAKEEAAKAAEEKEAALQEKEANAWKQAYFDYLKTNYASAQNPPTFGLFYIDGDEIPEAAVGFNGTDRTGQVELLTYYDGKVTSLGSIGSFTTFGYIPKKNRIRNDTPQAAFTGLVFAQHIENGKLVTDYLFGSDTSEDPAKYYMGTEGAAVWCSQEELNQKIIEYFPENEIRFTPTVDSGTDIYFCTEESLRLILDDPGKVTYS